MTLPSLTADERRAKKAEKRIKQREITVLRAGILRDSSAVDISARRRDYEAEGWERFDEDADPYDADQIRDYRAGLIVPPVLHN